jgi:hypothetical protein
MELHRSVKDKSEFTWSGRFGGIQKVLLLTVWRINPRWGNKSTDYIRAIKIEIRKKCTHGCIKVSRQLVASPPSDWTRETGSYLPRSNGCPRSEGEIGLLMKKIAHAFTWAVLRGEPFLPNQPEAIGTAFRDMLNFLSSRPNKMTVTAITYKRVYVQYLYSISRRSKRATETYTQPTFGRKVDGFVKLWVKP